jgi:hypothetical protein
MNPAPGRIADRRRIRVWVMGMGKRASRFRGGERFLIRSSHPISLARAPHAYLAVNPAIGFDPCPLVRALSRE